MKVGKKENQEKRKWRLNIHFCIEYAGRDFPV
jgi:hypothetical protein